MLDRARPWSERYDHSAWIDSVLEAQRRGQGPPQRVDDANDDGCDDEYGDFPCMHDDDEYGQNLPELTAEDAWGFESAPAYKRASAPELLSAHMRVPSTVNSVLGLNLFCRCPVEALLSPLLPLFEVTVSDRLSAGRSSSPAVAETMVSASFI